MVVVFLLEGVLPAPVRGHFIAVELLAEVLDGNHLLGEIRVDQGLEVEAMPVALLAGSVPGALVVAAGARFPFAGVLRKAVVVCGAERDD